MKNYMKKTIIAGLTFAFLLMGSQNVFASGPFNGEPEDCDPAIAIGVYGDIHRDSYGCWIDQSIHADRGDIVNVAMYYNNNTNQTLTNVSGSISKSSSGYNDTFTFTGRMYSNQGSQTIGTVTLHLSSTEKLIYKSTHIMKGDNAVRNNQDTSVVYNDGGNINIGNVGTGWNDYGEILVVYEVSDSNYDDNNDYYDNYCEIDSFTASDNYIDRGDYTTLKWRTTDCRDVTLTNVGGVDDDGSEKVYPRTTTTYTLRAYGDNGTRTKTVRVSVDQNNNNDYVEPVVIYNNNIVTTVATNISETGAILNGIVTNSKSNYSDVYFNYGKTTDLESRTDSKRVKGNVNFSSYVSDLTPGTLYYFQAISNDGDYVYRGTAKTFRTPGYVKTVVTQNNNTGTNTKVETKKVVTQGTTLVGANSPIVLKIENKYKAIGEGDDIDYTVYYKNISSLTLTNAMVQVYIPEGITLTDISNGTYSKDDRTLSVPVGDLSKDEDGTIYLKANVDNIDSSVAQIVTTAIIVYTSPNDTQENAMAYVLNNPKEGSNSLLGAAAFSSGFLGMGLIGWLVLTIVVLLLIIISRSLYGRREIKN